MIPGAIIIEGHVQGLSNVRALGEVGIPVYVMDISKCLAQYSKYCVKYFKCPDYNSESFIEFLLNIGKQESLVGWVLIPSNDHIVENLSFNSSKLTPYYKTIVPDIETLHKIINKKHLLDLAQDCGVPVPNTCYPDKLENIEALRFPLLLKGCMGLSFYKKVHFKAVIANNATQFKELLVDVTQKVGEENIMIQEQIPYNKVHNVVSFTCFSVNGRIKTFWIGEKLREHPLRYGTATFSKSIYISEILENAKPLIEALSYTGVCEIEFLWDTRDNKYKLIEMNPRTWLWVGLAKACGINYALLVYNYLNNIDNEYPGEYQVNVKWINWLTDCAFSLKAIFKGDLSILEYIRSLKGKKVNAVFSWRDKMPGFAFAFLSFFIAAKRR
jgi:predicted ATP-grasp superfamily ATP-dependent carboligase